MSKCCIWGHVYATSLFHQHVSDLSAIPFRVPNCFRQHRNGALQSVSLEIGKDDVAQGWRWRTVPMFTSVGCHNHGYDKFPFQNSRRHAISPIETLTANRLGKKLHQHSTNIEHYCVVSRTTFFLLLFVQTIMRKYSKCKQADNESQRLSQPVQ